MGAKRLRGKELAEALGARTGFAFADTALVERALTHASARDRAGDDYQRLEFLGDRVLGLVVAELLYQTFPDAPEGELSVRLNALVNAETLADIADDLDLGPLIRIGSDLRAAAERKQVNLRADVVEALIAVMHLEGGLPAARAFIHRHWMERVLAADAARRDPKTVLQEWAHSTVGDTPAYETETREGPDHDPLFTVAVTVRGYAPGRGRGRSKREAEQEAATAVLEREGVWAKREALS